MDTSLLALGSLIVVCLAIATIWHLLVKSYVWAVVASVLTVGLAVYWVYPIYRGVKADPLILMSAITLCTMIALGVGIPFKRRRAARVAGSNDRPGR